MIWERKYGDIFRKPQIKSWYLGIFSFPYFTTQYLRKLNTKIVSDQLCRLLNNSYKFAFGGDINRAIIQFPIY